MKRPRRWEASAAYLLAGGTALLLLAACQGSSPDRSEPAPSDAAAAQQEKVEAPAQVSRLVYGGLDGQIYLINSDGSDRQLVSTPTEGASAEDADQTQAIYTWPAWSPDGKTISYSQIATGGDGLSLSLLAKDLTGEETRRVYSNPPGGAVPVGEGIPHYTLWSPDGRRLAFLAFSPGGALDLLVSAPAEGDAARKVSTGVPFYYSWSPDSRLLLLHLGDDLLLYEAESGGLAEPVNVPSSGGYRAPAWSPDGQRIALLGNTDTGQALMVASYGGSDVRTLAPAPGQSAFLWSPRGDAIALGGGLTAERPFYSGIRLVDPDTGDVEQLTFDPIVGFFWSPDGEKLAYLRILAGGGHLAWVVVELDSRSTRTLAEFVPSRDLLSMFSFFDQYAYSHPLWSPDSTRLVFAGGVVEGDTPPPEVSHIYIVDASGDTPPQAITQGNMAFWPAN